MILLLAGVPAYVEPEWPHLTEAWLFCDSPGDLIELQELGKALGYQEWRPRHCPPHWRITDLEASLLDIPRVDSLTMTLHHRAWRRHMNDTIDLPKPKSHKRSGPPPDEEQPPRRQRRIAAHHTGTVSRGRRRG